MADIVLLTESKIAPEFNKYDEVARVAGAVHRDDIFPHDIHLNIVLLGTVLSRNGYDVKLLDNFLHVRAQKERLQCELEKKPIAVGLSTTFFYDDHSIREISEMIRQESPSSVIILGGPSLLQFPELMKYGDISVLYDGEEIIVKIMDRLKYGKGDLNSLPGLYLRDGNALHFTAERDPIDMSLIPFPDWNLLTRSRDLVYPIETQRGCPYSCKYCTYPTYSLKGGKLRLRRNEHVVEEFKRNSEMYGIRRYRICDSNFTAPPRRALDLCNMIIREGFDLEWSCYGRVDDVSDELANAMKEAGCRVIFVGLESGSDIILNNMNKRFKKDDIHRGLDRLKKAGMHVTGSFIIGFPGETDQTILETREVIMKSGLDCYLPSLFWVDQNSQIWRERTRYGLTGKGLSWSHSSMDSEIGKRLLSNLLDDVFINGGPPTGSDFDVVTMVNHGLTYEEALRFIKNRNLINLNKKIKNGGVESMLSSPEQMEEIRVDHKKLLFRMAKGHSRTKQEYQHTGC